MKHKIGIIGYGKMGKIRHDTIKKTSLGLVICIYEPDKNKHVKGFKFVESPDMVINSDINMVFICTPNFLIKNLIIKSLQKNLHVFAEKPPGISFSETLEIKKAEKKYTKCILMFGFNHRHHKSVKKIKEIIDSETLGKLLWIRGRYGKEVDQNFLKDWRSNKSKSGGGILLDQGIHMLDLFLYLGGNFDQVKSFVSNLFWDIPGIEDNVFAIFKNSVNGICASLHSTMTQWRYLFSLELFLEKGSLILNGLKTSSGVYGDEILTIRKNSSPFIAGNSKDEKQIIFNKDVSWESELTHFSECISNKSRPKLGNADDALILMEIINKIYNN